MNKVQDDTLFNVIKIKFFRRESVGVYWKWPVVFSFSHFFSSAFLKFTLFPWPCTNEQVDDMYAPLLLIFILMDWTHNYEWGKKHSKLKNMYMYIHLSTCRFENALFKTEWMRNKTDNNLGETKLKDAYLNSNWCKYLGKLNTSINCRGSIFIIPRQNNRTSGLARF